MSGKEVRFIHTDDLFLAGFALAKGGELHRVMVEGVNGRRIAHFAIGGKWDEDIERQYYQGPAIVQLQLLKAAVRRLKDEAFAAIREEERRLSHADAPREPGADRGHQGPRGFRRAHR